MLPAAHLSRHIQASHPDTPLTVVSAETENDNSEPPSPLHTHRQYRHPGTGPNIRKYEPCHAQLA